MSQEALKPSFKLLKNRSEIVGAEIGVYEGINARYYLKELDIKCVFLIDRYTAYENYDLDYYEKRQVNCQVKKVVDWMAKRIPERVFTFPMGTPPKTPHQKMALIVRGLKKR